MPPLQAYAELDEVPSVLGEDVGTNAFSTLVRGEIFVTKGQCHPLVHIQ